MKLKRMIGCAVAAASLPLLLGQGVASAANTTDTKSQSLTFISDTGQTLTCSFTASTSHNTDVTPNLAVATSSSECRGSMTTVLTYDDENGVSHSNNSFASSTRDLRLSVDHAAKHVAATQSVRFTACDITLNPCSLVLHTAPK